MISVTRSCCLCKHYCILISGVFFLLLGISMAVLSNCFLDIVLKEFVLEPNSALEEAWRKPSLEATTSVYIFNWTNPEDVRNTSIKPRFEQLGPFKFLQKLEKVNVVWNPNDTVTYQQISTWRCEDEETKRTLSANITTIDLIALCTAHKIRYWDYWSKTSSWAVVSASLDTKMYITRTASQLLFEGYEDPILEILKYLPFMVPEVPRFERFGWFATKNGSSDFDGVFNMDTGRSGSYELHNWNYDSETPYFEKSCGKVQGTAGDLYSAKRSRDFVEIFFSDICRNLLLEYEEDVTVNGILGYKYKVGDRILDNGTIYVENDCYCDGDCMPSGMLNSSSCRYGLPAYTSLPNFYGADPYYTNSIEGLHPEKEKHEGYLVLEPNTGVPLKAVLRLQLNTLVHHIDDIAMFEDVPTFFLPLIWIEHDIELSDDQTLSLKLFLYTPVVLSGVSYVLIILGVCLLIVFVYKTWLVSLCVEVCLNTQSIYLTPEDVPLKCGEDKIIITNCDDCIG